MNNYEGRLFKQEVVKELKKHDLILVGVPAKNKSGVKYGVINLEGEFQLNPIFNDIYPIYFGNVIRFMCSIGRIRTYPKYSMYDENENLLSEEYYYDLLDVNGGFVRVYDVYDDDDVYDYYLNVNGVYTDSI